MKILIGGDSWGCGELARGDLRNESVQTNHGGLAQYLEEAGHSVTNLSQGSRSNTFIYNSIFSYLDRLSIKNEIHPDLILVFQTEYTRDYQFRFEEDFDNVDKINNLAHIWLARFYHRLSSLAQQYNIRIGVIGGCADTIWIDNFQKEYPGVEIVCQSMVNLIVNDNHRVEHPVYSWYTKSTQKLIDEIKQTIPQNNLQDLLDQIDLGIERQNLLSAFPEYFWPDGVHANREGHKKLYNMLLDQKMLG